MLREALAGGDALCVSSTPVDVAEVPDECALVVMTSGSTARPKRVALSADALRASARATAGVIREGNWVLALPLTYIAGLMVVVRSIESGTDLVLTSTDSFDPDEFARIVAELPDGSSFTSLVPTQLSRLVDAADDATVRAALQRFDAILVGGQAIPAGLVDRATAIGARIIRTYGSAETAGGVVYDGVPIGDTQLRMSDDDVLEISGSSLASEYLGDPGLTAESFVDGWFRTTDRAHLESGTLVIDGRIDDVIVTGGIKVSLADIERVVSEAGIDAVASWFADDEWGQVPALVSTTNLDYEGVRELIAAELGKAARPYRIVHVSAIPQLASGKVDRRALREIVENDRP